MVACASCLLLLVAITTPLQAQTANLDADALAGSRLQLADLVTATSADPSSTVTVLPGVMPDIRTPDVVNFNSFLTIELEMMPGALYALLVSTSQIVIDSPFLEMVGLINPSSIVVVEQSIVDPTGLRQLSFFVPAAAAPVAGFPFT